MSRKISYKILIFKRKRKKCEERELNLDLVKWQFPEISAKFSLAPQRSYKVSEILIGDQTQSFIMRVEKCYHLEKKVVPLDNPLRKRN